MFREIREKIRLKHRVLNIRGRSLLTPSVRELFCHWSKLHLIASNSYSKTSLFVERRKSYSVVPQLLPFHQLGLFNSLRYSCLSSGTLFRFSNMRVIISRLVQLVTTQPTTRLTP